MATIAEIIIHGRDEYSRMTEEAKRKVRDLGRETKASMKEAKDSADILKDVFGIHLPRELTKLISQSQLIGPALAASFNVVAIVGFIAALRQIPEMFTTVNNAIHGWNETSKKAFEDFIEGANKASKAALDLQFRLNEALGKPIADNIDLISGKLRIAQRHLLDLSQERIEAFGAGAIRTKGRAFAEIDAEIEATKKQITELSDLKRQAEADEEVQATKLAAQRFENIVENDKKRIKQGEEYHEKLKSLRERAEDSWFNYQMFIREL